MTKYIDFINEKMIDGLEVKGKKSFSMNEKLF